MGKIWDFEKKKKTEHGLFLEKEDSYLGRQRKKRHKDFSWT